MNNKQLIIISVTIIVAVCIIGAAIILSSNQNIDINQELSKANDNRTEIELSTAAPQTVEQFITYQYHLLDTTGDVFSLNNDTMDWLNNKSGMMIIDGGDEYYLMDRGIADQIYDKIKSGETNITIKANIVSTHSLDAYSSITELSDVEIV